MKKPILFLTTTTLALLLFLCLQQQQTTAHIATHGRPNGPIEPNMFDVIDINKDGMLDRSEMTYYLRNQPAISPHLWALHEELRRENGNDDDEDHVDNNDEHNINLNDYEEEVEEETTLDPARDVDDPNVITPSPQPRRRRTRTRHTPPPALLDKFTDLSDDDITNIIMMHDDNGDGVISYSEWRGPKHHIDPRTQADVGYSSAVIGATATPHDHYGLYVEGRDSARLDSLREQNRLRRYRRQHPAHSVGPCTATTPTTAATAAATN